MLSKHSRKCIVKISYFGNHNVGCLCLRSLIRHNLAPELVVAQHANKDECLTYQSVEELAANNRIETFLYKPSQQDELILKLKEITPDLIVSVAWRYIFKKDILKIPQNGAINFHGSLLPRCRGANPTNWAIISGEKETGVTVHFMDEGIDMGDIIIQKQIPIEYEDTAYTLRMKQDKVSETIMDELVQYIRAGTFPKVKQDHSKATFFKKRKPEDGLIKWNTMTCTQIYDFVRALTKPYPGAFVYVNGKKIIIWKVTPQKNKSTMPAGKLISLADGLPVFSTLDGYVTLLDFECRDSSFRLIEGMCCDPPFV